MIQYVLINVLSQLNSERSRLGDTVYYKTVNNVQYNHNLVYVPGFNQGVYCSIVNSGVLKNLSYVYNATAYTYDLIGQGESDRDSDKSVFSMVYNRNNLPKPKLLEEQLLEVLDMVNRTSSNASKLYIVSHSFGSSIVLGSQQTILTRYPLVNFVYMSPSFGYSIPQPTVIPPNVVPDDVQFGVVTKLFNSFQGLQDSIFKYTPAVPWMDIKQNKYLNDDAIQIYESCCSETHSCRYCGTLSSYITQRRKHLSRWLRDI